METRYGRLTGRTPVFQALATLAWEPRRADVLPRRAVQRADDGATAATSMRRSMTGSWAGAMGQTQFMPSSYLKYAVDFDSDGRRDIWKSTPDALASIANYLKGFGWNGDETWGREVKVTAAGEDADRRRRFPKRTEGCYAIRNMTERRPLAEWQQAGRARARTAVPLPQRGDPRRPRRRRRAHVPRLPELRRDPRLQLRALLRADCCPVVGPATIATPVNFQLPSPNSQTVGSWELEFRDLAPLERESHAQHPVRKRHAIDPTV